MVRGALRLLLSGPVPHLRVSIPKRLKLIGTHLLVLLVLYVDLWEILPDGAGIVECQR